MSETTTPTVEDTGERCRTCGKPRYPHPYRHPFNGFFPDGSSPSTGSAPEGDSSQSVIPSSLPRVGTASGGDPVLRMVLLRKGMITVADLEEVVAELNATGVSGFEPPNDLG